MKLHTIISAIEEIAPLSFQESYDNSGLITGNSQQDITGALLTIDATETVVDEAIERKANLIIAHHPIVFGGMKSLTGKNYIERTVIKAIKNDIAIYAAHTNLDNITGGVNSKICEKLRLKNCKILVPQQNALYKLVTFVPLADAQKVRLAIFEAGAGVIGDYDQCSYNLNGQGTFRAGDNTNPHVGNKGELHFEDESRVETIFPKHLTSEILAALFAAHPYEEVAYDIYPLKNTYPLAGSGMIGETETPIEESAFLDKLQQAFNQPIIRHTPFLGKPVHKVAVCGGSGSFLLKNAIAAQADVFISGDFKYHQFFDAEQKILIADIGHYESEQFTKEVLYALLSKKFPNFALHLSEVTTNPVQWYISGK